MSVKIFLILDEAVYPTVREVYKAKVQDRLVDVPKYNFKAKKYGNNRKHKVNGHFEMASTQYHHYMETQQCICIPIEDGMDIYSSSQWTDTAHVAVAEFLKLPQNSLNFYVRRIGGAFGGKISRHAQVEVQRIDSQLSDNFSNFQDRLCSCIRLPPFKTSRSFNHDYG